MINLPSEQSKLDIHDQRANSSWIGTKHPNIIYIGHIDIDYKDTLDQSALNTSALFMSAWVDTRQHPRAKQGCIELYCVM